MPQFRTTARAGSTVFITGLVGRAVGGAPVDGLAAQVDRTLVRLIGALAEHQLTTGHIVRLRIYLTDVSTWSSDVLPRLLAIVGDVVPPATVIGVAALVEPWMQVEIDAEATTEDPVA